MGKLVIIVSFFACLFLALWLFYSRDTRSLRESLEQAPSHKKPRIILEGFTLRRYQGQSLQSEFQAAYADFHAPNKVQFRGGLKGWQWRQQHKQTVAADSAVAYFHASQLDDLWQGGELETASLEGHVAIHSREHTLYTDSADYESLRQKVSSSTAVRVEGPKRWLTGSGGFQLFIDEGRFDLYGKIQGLVQPERDLHEAH